MDQQQMEAMLLAGKWIVLPIGAAFVAALAAHLIMIFKLPGRIKDITESQARLVKALEHSQDALEKSRIQMTEAIEQSQTQMTQAIQAETTARERESSWMRSLLEKMEDLLRGHSDILRRHGEDIARLEARGP